MNAAAEFGRNSVSNTRFYLNMEMSRLTRDGTAEPVSRDQIFRRERGQGTIHFPCSADHEQDWQPYPVDSYSCYMCDYTYNTILYRGYFSVKSTRDSTSRCKPRSPRQGRRRLASCSRPPSPSRSALSPPCCTACDPSYLPRSTTECVRVTICVCVCVCVFIKLHITAQSGPVILVILCHSH